MKIIFSVLTLCFAVMLSGCANQEIDDTAYVVAIGIDKGKDYGYDITLAIADPDNIDEGASESLVVEMVTADSIFSAGDKISEETGQKVNFSHAELVVFSDDVATEGTEKFLTSVTRTLQQRPKFVPATTKSTAKETVSATYSQFESNPEKYLKKIFEGGSSSASVQMYGRDFLSRTKIADGGAALPCISVNEGKMAIESFDVFLGDKAVGELKDIYIYRLLCGNGGESHLELPGGTIHLIQRENPKIRISCGEQVHIDVEITLRSGVVSSLTDRRKIIDDAEDELTKRAENILAESARMGADVFGFYKNARKSFLTEGKWQSYNWREKYADATFDVHIRIIPEKTGLLRGES